MNPQTIIFIGRSGAGKGVQSKILQDFLREKTPNIPIICLETGAYFRKYVQQEGNTWECARKVNDTGGRQPDFLAVWIWSQFFIDNIKEGSNHLVIDGTPRSLNEAQILSTAFPFYRRENPTVVFLDISTTCAEERLRLRGRPDDLNIESVRSRQKWFEDDVAPAVEYYRNNPDYHFLEIDGEKTPEEVHQEIIKKLATSQ